MTAPPRWRGTDTATRLAIVAVLLGSIALDVLAARLARVVGTDPGRAADELGWGAAAFGLLVVARWSRIRAARDAARDADAAAQLEADSTSRQIEQCARGERLAPASARGDHSLRAPEIESRG